MKEIVNKSCLILFAFLLSVCCKSQKAGRNTISKIKVGFVVNDSACVLDSPFDIIVKKAGGVVLFSGTVRQDSVAIPDSLWNKAGYFNVSVNFKSYSLSFDSVSAELARPSKGMDWQFGIEKKPFLVVGSIIHPDSTKNDPSLKAIYFWRFFPYEGYVKHIIKKVY